MRIDELVPPKPLKPGAVGRVGNVTYKYDATAGWLDSANRPAQGIAKKELMKQYGRDMSGEPVGPSIGDRISSKLGGPFGQGTDPKANLFTKAMGKVGSAIGRGAAALIRPKAQPAAGNTDGNGQPDTQPGQQPTTPKPTAVGNPSVQNLNNYVKGVAAELNKPGADKIALTKELINFMADRKGTPEWDNASDSIKVILKRAGLNPNFANAALQRLQAGQTLESMQFMFINSLLESIGLTFADLGLNETVIENSGVKHYIVEDATLTNLKKLAGI